jgi:hypothetical protein
MGSVAQVFLFAVLVAAAAVLYLLPSLVASSRRHERAGTILLLNVFFGWTFAAWVVLLVWAFSSRPLRSL